MYLIDFSNKIYTLNGRKYERSITLKAGLEYSSRHIKKKKIITTERIRACANKTKPNQTACPTLGRISRRHKDLNAWKSCN